MTSNFAGQPSAETRGMRSEGAKQNRFCAMTCLTVMMPAAPSRFFMNRVRHASDGGSNRADNRFVANGCCSTYEAGPHATEGRCSHTASNRAIYRKILPERTGAGRQELSMRALAIGKPRDRNRQRFLPLRCRRPATVAAIFFDFGRHPPVWLVSALARLSCSTIISPRDCRTDERLIERRQVHGDTSRYTESAHKRG